MATSTAARANGQTTAASGRDERLTTETKAATKTTEFMLAVAVIVGILLSALLIKGGDTHGTDEFIARQAWLYVAIVTGAYAIGRGLAKSGSRETYWGGGTNQNRDDR